ncbi:MAG: hypothetical protein KDK78_03765, partial [Chlamydiia bacterium]|nr:hypothetical protein [Chlamydiia bacterium]
HTMTLSRLFSAMVLFLCTSLSALDLTLLTPDGNSITLQVSDDSTLHELHEQVFQYVGSDFFGFRLITDNDDILGTTGPLPTDLIGDGTILHMADPSALPDAEDLKRDYFAPMTEKQLDSLHYLIDTLSSKPVPLLLLIQSDLDEVGHDLDDVHPLRVFATIFTDETLQVGLRTMKRKRRVWTEWVDGIADSLNTAAERDNLTLEQAEDLAALIHLPVEHFWIHLQNRDWKRFMDTLVTRVPRPSTGGGGGPRYD